MTVRQQQSWWITGGGQGIGRELVCGLADAGHKVYVSARTAESLQSLAARYPGLVTALPVDVSDDVAMAAVFAQAPQLESLDGVILCAGICEYNDLPALDTDSIRRVMGVNFHGVVNACRSALPLLLKAAARPGAARPQIIGLGSMSSYIGFPRAEAYGASKAAMHYFLEALRCDVGSELDITVVFPGFVSTRLTANNDFPMPFTWSAEKAARHILARLGRGRRTIAFPWQLHVLLRLARLLPGLWYGVVMNKLLRQRGAGA
jgi:short-subunit dehydrogenase